MLKWKVTIFWRLTWAIFTPGLLLAIFVNQMARFKAPTYLGTEYHISALIGGWFVFIFLISQNFLYGIWVIAKSKNKKNSSISLFKPNELWGPKSPQTFKEWKIFKDEKLLQRKIQSESHSKLRIKIWKLLGKYK